MSLPWSKHSAWPMEHTEKPFPCGWSCLWRLRVQGCVGLELPPASFGSKVLHVFKGGCWDELGSGCGSFQDVDYALLGAGKQVQCDTSSIPNLMEHIPVEVQHRPGRALLPWESPKGVAVLRGDVHGANPTVPAGKHHKMVLEELTAPSLSKGGLAKPG